MSGQELLELDAKDLTYVEDLRDRVAQALGVDTNKLSSFVADGNAVGGAVRLDGCDFIVMKHTLLVERMTRMQALEEKRVARDRASTI